jgi:hypothetical protein
MILQVCVETEIVGVFLCIHRHLSTLPIVAALSGGQNIALLENVITTQRQIFQNVLHVADPATVPQSWCLYKEVYVRSLPSVYFWFYLVHF